MLYEDGNKRLEDGRTGSCNRILSRNVTAFLVEIYIYIHDRMQERMQSEFTYFKTRAYTDHNKFMTSTKNLTSVVTEEKISVCYFLSCLNNMICDFADAIVVLHSYIACSRELSLPDSVEFMVS